MKPKLMQIKYNLVKSLTKLKAEWEELLIKRTAETAGTLLFKNTIPAITTILMMNWRVSYYIDLPEIVQKVKLNSLSSY